MRLPRIADRLAINTMAPPLASTHTWREGRGEPIGAVQVDVEDPEIGVLVRVAREADRTLDPCVGDENVNRSAQLLMSRQRKAFGAVPAGEAVE